MNSQEKEKLQADLKKCETVGQVFRYLQETYDLESVKLGMLTRGPFIEGAIKGMVMFNPKRK